MATRSKQLATFSEPGAASPVTVYTVPTGYTTILKSARMWNASASSASLEMYVVAGGNTIPIIFNLSVAGLGILEYDGWIVLNAGDTVTVQGSANPFKGVVSGAELID